MRDLQHRRKYQREHYRKNRKPREPRETEFDKYDYRTVSSEWRNLVDKRQETYKPAEILSPLIIDILKGKTCLVDYSMPYGKFNHPFRTLYSYFQSRGLRLRVHIVDDTKNEKYRILLMWAETLKVNRSPNRQTFEEETAA